jgi:hypothetical protein
MVGTANAANIPVNANIAVSTTWTANNVYNLVGQIYVLPGATLTIEAGTQIRSVPTDQGSLAITRGAKIFVNGTAANPVVFTSTNDNGTWREAVNEWGNLTIMGNGLISASHFGGLQVGINTKDPSGLNVKQMEGLTDPVNGIYGGNNDNDDSGALHYVSFRYGGKVLGLGNELNGLSLGAIGRNTDIDHVDIMNNVDDGIEIWGGTVNLKYVSIWNIGDDSFDIDQGWRGKAQFGLIVQGYSANASQGSGVGDNAIEHDGAEDSDAQPVTTATLYNFTVIGQPDSNGGDHGAAWRDNARLQHRNAIFMDLGERLVGFDNVDGDGAQGYGYNGTLSWADTWTTNAGTHSTVNPCVGCSPGDFNHANTLYTVQTSGKLAEITDSVFYNNNNAAAYTEANARGVTVAGDDNPALNNVVAASSPITSITRGPVVIKGGKPMAPVTLLDPRAANDAIASAASAPADGFFTPVPFRGAFSKDNNWLCGWTAAYEFGMTTACANPGDPVETITMTATACFPTTNGVLYSVEESSDNVNWSPVAAIAGDGTNKCYTDLGAFDSAKFYRSIAQ